MRPEQKPPEAISGYKLKRRMLAHPPLAIVRTSNYSTVTDFARFRG